MFAPAQLRSHRFFSSHFLGDMNKQHLLPVVTTAQTHLVRMMLLMLLVSCYEDPTSIPPAIGQTPCDLDWAHTKQATTGWTVQRAAHQSKFIPWALQDSVVVLHPTKYRSVFRFSLVAAFPPFLFQNKKLRFPFFQTRHLKNWAGVSQTKGGYMRTSSPFSVQGKWPELCCKRMF